MTKQDIEALVYIKRAVRRLAAEVEELNLMIGLKAVNMDGMPHGSMPGSPTERMALQLVDLEKEYKRQIDILEAKKLEIMRWYNEFVDDEIIKEIIFYRYIQGPFISPWRDVAVKIGYGDHTTYFKMYDNFWKKQKKLTI